MPRILLVAPAFHGYWESLAFELQRRGHSVTPFLYDANRGVARKVRNKLEEFEARRRGVQALRRTQRITSGAISALRASRPHRVIAVKADAIGPEFWEEAHIRRVSVTLYLYDEMRRMSWSDARIRDAVRDGLLLTYSREDFAYLSQRHPEVRFWANAFDERFVPTPRQQDEVVFIGARYPIREQALVALSSHGVPVRAYGRDWSHHWFDKARTWNAPRPDLPSERDVSRREGYSILAGARAALNVHSNQDGFTMRTFEIPGSGGLQLIDRPDVTEFFDPGGEVLVWQGTDELIELSIRAGSDPAWARRIRDAGRRRALAHHTYRHRISELEAWWS